MRNTARSARRTAAGNRAKAIHDGTFVWASNEETDFASTGVGQFLIRAAGGVGIGTTDPIARLHISASVAEAGIYISGSARDITWPSGQSFQFGQWNGVTFTERVRISPSGHFGIGLGGSTPTRILEIVQNSTTDPIADAWTLYSSRRWKDNIETLPNALDKVQRLRGVEYDWKADGRHDIGLIAEEVGEVIPEVVKYEANGVDAESVDYARLVAVLIEGIKEQQEQIIDLRSENESLSERLQRIEREL